MNSGHMILLGVVVGAIWALVDYLFWIPMPQVLAAVAFYPVFEELVRAAAVVGIARSAATHVTPVMGAAFGLGFGLAEAIRRWIGVLSRTDAHAISYLAPLVPVFLHVLLSVLMWRDVARGHLFRGYLTCLALHVLHNGYVWTIVRNIDGVGVFVLELLLRTATIVGVTVIVVRSAATAGAPSAKMSDRRW